MSEPEGILMVTLLRFLVCLEGNPTLQGQLVVEPKLEPGFFDSLPAWVLNNVAPGPRLQWYG